VLFLGRIIDGITGANMSVSFAYIADLTPPGQRGKYFGMMGALFGIGFIVGPAIGGFLSQFGYEVPFYVAAALTFANVIYGLFGMPESLPKEKRSAISAAHLNPFSALIHVVSVPQIRWILLATFLYGVPFAALSVNIALFPKDALSWSAAEIGIIFVIVGVTDIVVQGVLLQLLFKRFSESQIAVGGLVAEIVGYLLIASIGVVHSPIPLLVGTVIFAMGDGLLGPSLSGLLSRVAGSQSQGQVQGASQSVQSLSRIAGPFLGGLMYDYVGHASPFIAGAAITVVAIITLLPILTTLQQVSAEQTPAGDTSSQPAAG
jgi:DHA1 family tetracycline resistance protein-like MFS transporter